MNQHEKLNYLEFAANDLAASKVFFQTAFSWSFTDYGPEYIAFNNQGLEGGFYQANMSSKSDRGGALVVFYSEDIDSTLKKVVDAGGVVVKPLFDFPGGRRFHFEEPSGNEFAVWAHPLK